MENRKGLSTINQGGDDLAIRIAAMERRRNDVLSSKYQGSDDTQRLASEGTFALSSKLACVHIFIYEGQRSNSVCLSFLRCHLSWVF